MSKNKIVDYLYGYNMMCGAEVVYKQRTCTWVVAGNSHFLIHFPTSNQLITIHPP